jgi:GR25 family glycosyltransferase involved in LPS biosynthesis
VGEVKAFVITLTENTTSTDAATKLVMSNVKVGNEFVVETFDAITPNQVDREMILNDLCWEYPWDKTIRCMKSGLTKHPYTTVDRMKRMACFLSHYNLWKLSAIENRPLIILEHDAIFTRKVDLKVLKDSRFGAISLNDPRGATRRAQQYHTLLQKGESPVCPVAVIDEDDIPQGLPGHSAYYISPHLARTMMTLVNEFGAWPNDALMCRQLIPRRLGCLQNYCTKVQGITSSTST